MVTLFIEGTKGPSGEAVDTEDACDSLDPPRLLSLVLKNVGFGIWYCLRTAGDHHYNIRDTGADACISLGA